MQRYYDGTPLETGKTSMAGVSIPAPAVRWLFEKRILVKGMKVLDYGAGNGRNANFLRDEGMQVYAYDPHNGYNVSGYDGTSLALPSREDDFDTMLTCFVLNVVPKRVEQDIIRFGESYNADQIHITRNQDLLYSIDDALDRKDKTVTGWYNTYNSNRTIPSHGINWYELQRFCNYGVKTSRGFQRDVHLWEDYSMGIEHQTHGYKIFMNY